LTGAKLVLNSDQALEECPVFVCLVPLLADEYRCGEREHQHD